MEVAVSHVRSVQSYDRRNGDEANTGAGPTVNYSEARNRQICTADVSGLSTPFSTMQELHMTGATIEPWEVTADYNESSALGAD